MESQDYTWICALVYGCIINSLTTFKSGNDRRCVPCWNKDNCVETRHEI